MAIEALTKPSSVFDSMNSNTTTTTESANDITNDDTKISKVSAEKMEINAKKKEKDENATSVSADKVKKAVEEINNKIRPIRRSCQFAFHDETNRISIKVIDEETDKVIREIPAEKALDIIAKTLELEGLLVDEKR